VEKVVISVLGGVASIEFQTDDVDVHIFDMDNEETYLYKNEYICIVTNINTDGTVDIKTIGNISGKRDRRLFMDVQAVDLEYFNLVLMDEDYDILTDEEVD
jgi:hypothetical protein